MSEVSPTLPSLLDKRAKILAANIRVSTPAKIKSFDSNTGKASVQVLIMENDPGEDGVRNPKLPAVINDVPVMFEGSGGKRLVYPVSPGDVVLLVYSDRSLDRWLVQGGEVDPGDDRTHHIADAIAIPGLMDFRHAGKASHLIEFTAIGEIKIGAQVGHEPTFKGTTYNTAMTTLLTALSAYAVAIKPVADPSNAATPALTAAITAFLAAAPAALTLHVKVT